MHQNWPNQTLGHQCKCEKCCCWAWPYKLLLLGLALQTTVDGLGPTNYSCWAWPSKLLLMGLALQTTAAGLGPTLLVIINGSLNDDDGWRRRIQFIIINY